MLDIISLKAQEEYINLNDTYVIFITKHDVLGYKKPLYHINRTISEVDEAFNDGSHIMYINTAYTGNDNSKITDLIHDFKCTKASEIRNEHIRNRFNEIKSKPTKEEVDEMSELLEARMKKERAEGIELGIEQGRAENSREIAKTMLLSGKLTVELIAEFCNLTVNEVKALNNPT